MIDLEPAMTLTYRVFLDHTPLGIFTGCDGLTVELVTEQREEGGNNDFIHILPVRHKYTNVKLTRPVDPESHIIARYMSNMTSDFKRGTAEIQALGWGLAPIARWSLRDVIPVRWSGPSLSADTNKVATETLELAHHGFL